MVTDEGPSPVRDISCYITIRLLLMHAHVHMSS
jgi:hypothetical protein